MRWSVGCEYDGRGPDAEGDQGPCPGDGEGEKRMDTAGRSPRLDTRHPPRGSCEATLVVGENRSIRNSVHEGSLPGGAAVELDSEACTEFHAGWSA